MQLMKISTPDYYAKFFSPNPAWSFTYDIYLQYII